MPSGKPHVFASDATLAFHRRTLVFDCLSLFYIIEEPYAEEALAGGVDVTNVTFGTEEDWDTVLRNFETGLAKIEKSPILKLALTSADILAAKAEGKLACIVGTQGAAMLGDKPARFEILYRLGLRILGLAYTGPTMFADGCGEKRDGGLTFLGEELIEAVNRRNVLFDLSHAGHRARAEATKLARSPVCTHSNAYGLNANDRNTKDDTARAIVAKGGMLGICGLPKTVWPTQATVGRMVDHCDYYVKLLGHEHVGIGCDFVAAYKAEKQVLPASRLWRTRRPDVFGTVDEFLTLDYPEGLSEIRQLPNLTQTLFDRGYTEAQAAAILGGNWFECFKRHVG